MKTCFVKGCEREVKSREMCGAHYRRWYRGAKLEGVIREKYSTDDERVVPEWEPGLVTHSPAGNVILHGGSGMGYRSYGCRCRACTEANRHRGDVERKKRSSGVIPETVPHGKATTYSNWGCRCEPCTKAQTEKCNGYYSQVLSADARYKAEMEAYEAGMRKGPKPTRKRVSRSED